MPLALLAFGFESLPMLGWLAAASAPWLIHLLSRRRYRETSWAAMDFLLAAVKRRTRRVRLEHLLLLLLRTLVIVTIVLAVAEPYTTRSGPVFTSGGPTHRIFVIDSSFSMAYKPNDRSRFEQAKRWAAEIVDRSSPGDGFSLVQMADPPRTIIATPGLEPEPVRQEIENLELLHTGADLSATLDEIRKTLDIARRDRPELTRHEIYIISDLQRATWAPAASESARADLRSRAAELAGIARLEVIDLGQPGDDNLAITALDLHDPAVLAGHSAHLTATLHDFGRAERRRQAVELLIDGRLAGHTSVDVPPGGEAVAQFTPRFDAPGEHTIEVRAPGGALEIDNHRYLAVQVREAIRVLCIDGRPAGDPKQASVYALANALVAQRDPDRASAIRVEVATERAISERNLASYDCVMLSNVAQFTANEAQVLESYLARGGSLVFFLGDRVLAENYNRFLVDRPRPILPARLAEPVANHGGRLDPLEYRHPIVEPFRGQEKAGLLGAPVERYFKVQPLAARERGGGTIKTANEAAAGDSDLIARPPQVALALGNGDPLIVTRALRRGRVVLVATSADMSWTVLPALGTYLPLVWQTLDWCIAGKSQPRNVAVGDPLEGSLDEASSSARLMIERPNGHRRSVATPPAGGNSWTYDDTLLSGIYTVLGRDATVPPQYFAVNVKTAESDLATISRDELQNVLFAGVAFGYHAGLPSHGRRSALAAPSSAPLHVELLYAVVGLLLLETLAAWRLGRNR